MISKAFAAVFMLIGVLIIGAQVMVAVRSTQLMQVYSGWGDTIEDHRDRSAPPEEVKVDGRSFTLMTAEGRRVHRELEAMLRNPEKAMEHREASIETVVTANDMLKEGEALPSPAMIELMVTARAARLADDDCALMLETIAARCVVTHVNTSRIGRSDDPMTGDTTFEVRASMVFLPKDPLGDLPEADTLVVHEQPVRLDNLPLADLGAATVRAGMAEALTGFVGACRDLREIYGNCMVLEPRLSVSARDEGSLQRSMRLIYLAPMQVAAEVVPEG